MSTMFELVSNTLIQRFEVPADQVRPETELEEVLHDSLDFVEFATLVGDRLGVKISDEDLESVQTVSDFVSLLETMGVVV